MTPLAVLLASLGLTFAAPPNIQVIQVSGTLTATNLAVPSDGTVCYPNLWWSELCDAEGASKTAPTILWRTASGPGVLVHEAAHAIHGIDGPPDDPNNEQAATAAGCAVEHYWLCDAGTWWRTK